MKKLYIHIGQQKTGTSTLQAFMAANRVLLEEKGIYYPMGNGEFIIREKNGTMAGNAVSLRTLAYPLEQLDAARINNILQIASLFVNYECVLLSDEVLWSVNPVVFENLTKLFSERNIIIKIIVYLRRQDERMESRWNQAVKGEGYSGTCVEFAEKHKHEWNYYKQLKEITDIIGKENMIVKIYETESFIDGKSIIKDFLSVFGIWDLSEFKFPEFQANPSLSKEMAVIRQVMNSIPSSMILDDEFRRIYKEEGLFKKNSETVSKVPSFLTYHEKKKILAECKEGNERIGMEYFGINKSPFRMLEDQDDNNCVGGGIEELCKEIICFFGKLLIRQAEEMELLHWKTDEYTLPENVREGSRVVVYGADQRGCRVYHWLKKQKKYEIAGFVDMRWKKINRFEKECTDPMDIFSKKYDFILISVAPKDTGIRIKNWLEMNGVEKNKIVFVS